MTWMPAGRLCTYAAVDGGTVSTQTGWPATIAGLIATAVVAVATGIAVRLRGERSVIVTWAPAVIIVPIWFVVIFSAHSVSV